MQDFGRKWTRNEGFVEIWLRQLLVEDRHAQAPCDQRAGRAVGMGLDGYAWPAVHTAKGLLDLAAPAPTGSEQNEREVSDLKRSNFTETGKRAIVPHHADRAIRHHDLGRQIGRIDGRRRASSGSRNRHSAWRSSNGRSRGQTSDCQQTFLSHSRLPSLAAVQATKLRDYVEAMQCYDGQAYLYSHAEYRSPR